MLSSAILTWLKPSPEARAIITYPLRVVYLDEIRELWELLQHGGLEAANQGGEQRPGVMSETMRYCTNGVCGDSELEVATMSEMT